MRTRRAFRPGLEFMPSRLVLSNVLPIDPTLPVPIPSEPSENIPLPTSPYYIPPTNDPDESYVGPDFPHPINPEPVMDA